MIELAIQRAIKRLFDILISLVALVVLSPLFLVAAFAIKLDSKGPVFFKQERVGMNGKLFKVWKFRTMVEGAVRKGLGYTVARDDTRITRVGAFLRNFGLDELPQLINVLAGSMSIVGPRPTLKFQVDHYNAEQRRRLDVPPGITSLAVVSGRNALSWADRIELDLEYIDNWSLLLDLKIILQTFWVVLITREGLYGDDGVNDLFVDPNASEKSTNGADTRSEESIERRK